MTAGAKSEEGPGGVLGWVENRLHLAPFIGALLHVRIPANAKTFYLGGITLFLFGIQVVTGTLLALYYSPTPEAAYESVLSITSDVQFGWLIRSVHHWAANLMLLFLVLHLLRIFVQAAYKYPREITWIVGGGLLLITIGFGFTGYLLPWDQRAYWATVVGTEIAGDVPVIGSSLLLLLRGGAEVSEATLARFFGIHVLVLPLLLGGLVALHLLFVHQQGLANPSRAEARPGRVTAPQPPDKLKPFFPDYILDEVIAWYAVLAGLVILASLFPAGLEPKADPLVTPEHIKPEWYFLAVYQLLKLVPETVGVVAPVALVMIIVLLPLLDRNEEIRPRRRPIALGLALVLLVAMAVLTYFGGRV
ncbi:MAG: cytochrome bc complex cytochrome b subunit [Chloroflexota bacterium]|nr:MAG: cytochrome bc complex cytochrome b subunit [Chloroflexota bacterium]